MLAQTLASIHTASMVEETSQNNVNSAENQGKIKSSNSVKHTPQSSGGQAQARNLSPDTRSEIDRQVALERWGVNIPRANYTGEMRIGNTFNFRWFGFYVFFK